MPTPCSPTSNTERGLRGDSAAAIASTAAARDPTSVAAGCLSTSTIRPTERKYSLSIDSRFAISRLLLESWTGRERVSVGDRASGTDVDAPAPRPSSSSPAGSRPTLRRVQETLSVPNEVAAELAGVGDGVLDSLRSRLHCTLRLRGNQLTIEGDDERVAAARAVVDELVELVEGGHEIGPDTVGAVVAALDQAEDIREVFDDVVWRHRGKKIAPKTVTQKRYVDSIRNCTVTFGIGPAGTGKTYLAMALAVAALAEKQVARIILTRPAVEAGERLGFLPGDMLAKVDPYLRPLFDALYDMLDADRLTGHMERGVIEVAPLAFMRGRAQPVDSMVLTPAGFRPIGTLDVGDLVIASDGKPTPVLGVYPQGRREVFDVRAQDGSSTRCCAEHLWFVTTPTTASTASPAGCCRLRSWSAASGGTISIVSSCRCCQRPWSSSRGRSRSIRTRSGCCSETAA